jgi:hypothetical protein
MQSPWRMKLGAIERCFAAGPYRWGEALCVSKGLGFIG